MLWCAFITHSYIIPGYTSLIYTSSVEKHFDDTFQPLNERLRSYGIEFNTRHASCYGNGSYLIESGFWKGFRETVPCVKSAASKQFSYSTPSPAKWSSESHQFELLLQANKWVLVSDPQVNSISQFLLSGLTSTSKSGIFSHYITVDPPHRCVITIIYTNNAPDRIDESCRRDVSYFGSYTE